MARHSRRSFLRRSLGFAAATFAIGGTKSSGKILGANDTVRVAVAGINGRGGSHIQELLGVSDVDITYLVDIDKRIFESRARAINAKSGSRPQTVQDVRRALDDPNLDALTIATPNHWHTLMAVWACQAGKDVYVEKPCSHNVHEGRVAFEAARKYNRIVQHGTQSRSSMAWARVVEVIKSGQLGKLQVSRALCYKPRGSIGFKDIAPPPPDIDFNLWLGPAPEQPYHANLVHYNWHWFWDFGNGDIGNQGVHQMDIARWGIPGATLPQSVISLGGRFGYKDQGQTPNTQVAVLDYGETKLVFEVRGLKTDGYRGEKVGNIFHLEAGTIVGTDKFYPKDSDQPAPLPKVEASRGPGGDHFGNFIAAVRSRRPADLNAEILEGHYSSALCHLANMSYRLGKDVAFDASAPSADRKELKEAFDRMGEHLTRGNGVALEGLNYRLGRTLKVDATAETIVGDPEAQKLLTREYRKPFVVPQTLA